MTLPDDVSRSQSFILQRGCSETQKREADDFLFANSDSAGWKMFACGAASSTAVLKANEGSSFNPALALCLSDWLSANQAAPTLFVFHRDEI